MYPIDPLQTKFTFDLAPNAMTTSKWKVSPGVNVIVKYLGDKSLAMIELTYIIRCENEKGETILTASAKNGYSIIKNDDLDLPHKSDTVYYCIKMLERDFSIFLREKGQEPNMPKIPIDPITYQGYMSDNQSGILFSQN